MPFLLRCSFLYISRLCRHKENYTHTHQYWHLSLYSCFCVLPRSDQSKPPETRFILIPQQPPMQGFIFVRNEEENMNMFSSLMFGFNYNERGRMWTWLNVGRRANGIKFYENSFYQMDGFLHSYGWRVMAGTIKTICSVFW